MQRLTVRGGQRGEIEFSMVAPGAERAEARLQLLPFMPVDGTYATKYTDPHEHDATSWFTNRDETLSFNAGEQKTYKFQYTVPRVPNGIFWTMLKFQPKPLGAQAGMSVIYEIPVIFSVGTRERPILRMTSPSLSLIGDQGPNSTYMVSVPLENTGVGFAPVGASGDLRNLVTNRLVAAFHVSDRNLFPGTKRDLTFGMGHLSDGRYSVRSYAEVGNRRLPATTAQFAIIGGVVKPMSEASTLELTPLVTDPSGFSLHVAAGASRFQRIRVTNVSKSPITVGLQPDPLEQAETGSIGLGSGPLPAGISVKITPEQMTLAPGGSDNAMVQVVSTPDAKGQLWFGVALVQQGNPNALPQQVVGDVTLKGTEDGKLEVVGPVVDTMKGRPVGIRFKIHNSGNLALRVKAQAVMLESGVRKVAEMNVPVLGDGGILPGVSLPNSVVLPPEIKPGQHIAQITYNYGEGADATLRVPITIPGAKPGGKPAVKPAQKPAAAKPKPRTPPKR
jgi:hypothetical protein